MQKLDLRKAYKSFYVPPAGKCALVEIPTLQFAAINGRIEPGKLPGESNTFREALQALYGVSYTLKFISKLRARNPIDYTVMALEALWWGSRGTIRDANQTWRFTAMILQPDHITPRMFAEAVARVKAKRPGPALRRLRLWSFREGLCVQAMHVGPYAGEARTLKMLEEFAAEQGLAYRGKQHEIYIGDPMRAEPAKLRTVLRHPVKRTR